MIKLEIIGHVYSNVNGRIIVTPPEGVSQREQSIETYLENADLFPYLSNGDWTGSNFTVYKKSDKLKKIPKVKVTIIVEEL